MSYLRTEKKHFISNFLNNIKYSNAATAREIFAQFTYNLPQNQNQFQYTLYTKKQSAETHLKNVEG